LRLAALDEAFDRMEDAMIDTQDWIIKLQKGTMPWASYKSCHRHLVLYQ